MYSFLFVLLICGHVGEVEDVLVDHVDKITLNHYYDAKGKFVLDQIIFWDFVDTQVESGVWSIRDWRMVKPDRVRDDEEDKKRWIEKNKVELEKWKEYRKDRNEPQNVMYLYPGKFVGGRMVPIKQGNKWILMWHDTHQGDVLRRVTADIYEETWTQDDPEIENRDKFPKEKRKKLSVRINYVKPDPVEVRFHEPPEVPTIGDIE